MSADEAAGDELLRFLGSEQVHEALAELAAEPIQQNDRPRPPEIMDGEDVLALLDALCEAQAASCKAGKSSA